MFHPVSGQDNSVTASSATHKVLALRIANEHKYLILRDG